MADAKPFSDGEIKDRQVYFEHKKALLRASTGSKHVLDFVEDRYLATIAADRKRIEELGEYDGNDDHPENRCQRCRGRNLHNWYADSDVWNQVTQDKWSVLCPNCFVELAREAGIDPTAWRISSEGDDPEINKCRVAIADQAATIERLRGRLEQIRDFKSSITEYGKSFDFLQQIARKALDEKE